MHSVQPSAQAIGAADAMATDRPLPAPPARLPMSAGAVLTLLKPITWFAPMWAFMCGVVSAGVPLADRWPQALLGALLAGPLVCGTSQAANDWFDREVDAINEPNRPIPSGQIPGSWGLYIALIWTGLCLLVAGGLGSWGFGATVFGLVLAWIYSAPPLRLKLNGWWGNAACAMCYEGLPWITAVAVLTGGQPSLRVFATAALYSAGAHGIMTLNDFKSVEGDRQMGVGSLPVKLGVERAAKFACLVMAVPQMAVVALLLHWGSPLTAAIVAALLVVQLVLMVKLLRDPRQFAPWYNATGTSLYVLGMLAAAFALKGFAS